MGLNKRYLEKYEKAYAGLPEIRGAIDFEPTSPYYHMEEWRDVLPRYVPGVLENTYKISTHGRVYTNLRSPSYPNGGIMAHSINARGYHQINLKTIDGGKTCVKITRLVMLHFRFIPGCHLMEVDHIDGDKDNNCLWNFQWVTPQENVHRAIRNGLRPVSVSAGMYNEYQQKFLEDEQAKQLFLEAYTYKVNNLDMIEICKKYGVSLNYINGLLGGSIRPYIRKNLEPMLYDPDIEFKIEN